MLGPDDLRHIARVTIGNYDRHADGFREGTKDHDLGQNVDALRSRLEGPGPLAIRWVLRRRPRGAGATCRKTYRVLGAGVAAQETYEMTAPIGPVAQPLLGTVQTARADGRPSRSHARVLERRAASTLLEVEIETGCPHQIRIHPAVAGHPLVGDPPYAAGGGPRTDGTALPGDGGYVLHAERLVFAHPVSGKAMALPAPRPVEPRTATEP